MPHYITAPPPAPLGTQVQHACKSLSGCRSDADGGIKVPRPVYRSDVILPAAALRPLAAIGCVHPDKCQMLCKRDSLRPAPPSSRIGWRRANEALFWLPASRLAAPLAVCEKVSSGLSVQTAVWIPPRPFNCVYLSFCRYPDVSGPPTSNKTQQTRL